MPKQVTLNIGLVRALNRIRPGGRIEKTIHHKNITGICLKGVSITDPFSKLHPRVKAFVEKFCPGWNITGYAKAKRKALGSVPCSRNAAPRPLVLFANSIDLQDAHRDARRNKHSGHKPPRLLMTPTADDAEHMVCNTKVAVFPLTKRNGLTLRFIQEAILFYKQDLDNQARNQPEEPS